MTSLIPHSVDGRPREFRGAQSALRARVYDGSIARIMRQRATSRGC